MGRAEKLFLFSVILRSSERSLSNVRISAYFLRDFSASVEMTTRDLIKNAGCING